MTFQKKIVQLAKAYAAAGIKESGYNEGDEVEFFQMLWDGKKHDPWCAFFVWTCVLKAWLMTQKEIYSPKKQEMINHINDFRREVFSATGSCYLTAKTAEQAGLFREKKKYTPKPGDLVLYSFNSSFPNHIGIVIEDGMLFITTVEGNTSSGPLGSQRDGQGIYVRRRPKWSGVYGYVALSAINLK